MLLNNTLNVHGNYYTIPNAVLALGLSPGAIVVYNYLSFRECRRRGDKDRYTCHPSMTTIGEAIGRSARSVRGYVQKLVEAGLILTEPTKVTTARAALERQPQVHATRPTARGGSVPRAAARELRRKPRIGRQEEAQGDGEGGEEASAQAEAPRRVLDTVAAAEAFLAERGFTLQELVDASGFAKVNLLQTAANAVSASLEERKAFQTFANELQRLMKYADREDIAPAVRKRCNAIIEIDAQLRKKRRHASNVDLMVQINQIISDYVQIEQPVDGLTESRRFDISQIDFDLLRAEFARAKQRNLVLKDLEDLIQERLEKMVAANPGRINYYERYQQIIEDYNSEQDSATIEKTFMDLMDLANSMGQEEQRYVREGFENDEELSIYDLLFSESLSKQDIKKIKEVASSLLKIVKAKIAELDHWTDKQETKATIDTLIRDTLWAELPECYDEISISSYRQKIYEYVYTRYPEVA